MTYCLSTDMAEEQIVFGGEKKLREAVREAYALFKPAGHRHPRHVSGGSDR